MYSAKSGLIIDENWTATVIYWTNGGVHCWPSQGGTSALSPLSCSFSFFLARLIAVASTVYTCLVCNSSTEATCHSIPAARFAFRLFYSFCFSCS